MFVNAPTILVQDALITIWLIYTNSHSEQLPVGHEITRSEQESILWHSLTAAANHSATLLILLKENHFESDFNLSILGSLNLFPYNSKITPLQIKSSPKSKNKAFTDTLKTLRFLY